MFSSSGSRWLDVLRAAGIAPTLAVLIAVVGNASWAAESPPPAPPASASVVAPPAPERAMIQDEASERAAPEEALSRRARQPEPPGPASIIRRVDNPDMQIAITFDACATRSHGYGFDLGVYEVLRRERVPATIFVSGRWVEFHPDVMTVLVDNPLIEFANHSYDHPHMTRLSTAAIASEIDRTEAALGRHGVRSVAFRPPFGDFSNRVLEVARDRGLRAVLWDVVSGDPSRATTAAGMIRTVVHKTRSGSIVIFHINGRGAQTAPALPSILRQLREQGFQFVHVSTLLAAADEQKAPPVGDETTLRRIDRPGSVSVAAK